jgi:predicted ATPase
VVDSLSGSPFVGRDRELAELLDSLDGAAAGRGRLVVIGGEPGIGKSRLADELANHARAGDFEVLWGRGWEDAGAPPFWLWVQALRSHVRSTDPAELRRQLGPGAGDVAQILPELRQLYPDLPPSRETGSDSARFQLFDSTVRFLREVARERPLLLVLDDLQVADTPSVVLLRFLASQLSDIPMLVIATYRDFEVTPEHPLATAIAEMAREPITRTFVLEGLGPDALKQFVGAAAGVAPHDHLVAAIWRQTTGNPLFVGEAIRLLSAEGRLTEVSDLPSLRVAVPVGIRAVIARRIGHLGEATTGALRLGAALGPEFGLEVLRRIGGYAPDKALDLVDDAVQAGVLLPVAGVLGRYRFSHDLVRETLYDDLLPGPRVRLHRRIAEVLEEVHAASLDVHLAELAYHYGEAVHGGEGDALEESGRPAVGKAID